MGTMTKKYINVLTGQEIIVYPWTSEEIKVKVKNDPDFMEMFEEY